MWCHTRVMPHASLRCEGMRKETSQRDVCMWEGIRICEMRPAKEMCECQERPAKDTCECKKELAQLQRDRSMWKETCNCERGPAKETWTCGKRCVHVDRHVNEWKETSETSVPRVEEIGLQIITTAKILNKVSLQSPQHSSKFSQESPKFQIRFHGRKRSPSHSNDNEETPGESDDPNILSLSPPWVCMQKEKGTREMQ